MPLIEKTSFPGPPFWQFNGHLQTLVPSLTRKVRGVSYSRERIVTPDGDFLDLDWVLNGSRKLVVLTHGLEGNTTQQYMLGNAKLFSRHGWDVLAWNCRSCSGEMNRAFRLYHHGDTEDIATVVRHALATRPYTEIAMIGYSMGANITLKYLGTGGGDLPAQIKAAVVFSAPCDLESGAKVLDRWDNRIYRRHFLNRLSPKIQAKNHLFPGRLQIGQLQLVRQWRDFDEWFSAPICGYRDAADFYKQASAKNFIPGIAVPTLLVNAGNDPILTDACMPLAEAREHPFFYFEQTETGGHCGFMTQQKDEFTWSERRALDFCMEMTG